MVVMQIMSCRDNAPVIGKLTPSRARDSRGMAGLKPNIIGKNANYSVAWE